MKSALLLCLLPAALFCAGPDADHQGTGYLKVNATPNKSGVFVDGVYFGPATHLGSSQRYYMTPGQHQVTVVNAQYEDGAQTVRIESGKTLKISQTLRPKPDAQPPFARLRVICSKELAAVMVNDQYAGKVDDFDNGVPVNPGKYNVRIDLRGGEALLWEQVTLEAGKTTTVRWD